MDLLDAKITIPLKQFRVCRKRSSTAQQRQKAQVSSIRELMKGTRMPVFQVYLGSRILFAKRQLWIGFDNNCHQELWYCALRTIIAQTTGHKRILRMATTKQSTKLNISRPSELDLLASALPTMIDNEIYESTSINDTYSVVIIQTEKSKELGLIGRYLLRVTPVAFALLNPICHSTVHLWPLRFVRKFGVHMKRLYLITGSGCEGGKGLFIFLVQEATSLQNRLLLLTRHIESSVILSRDSQHMPVLPTSPTAEVREFNDTLQSTGYWFQPDSFVKAPLASPLSVGHQEACNIEQTSLGSRSIQKRLVTPKGTPPVSVTAYDFGHPSSYSTDVSRELRLINSKCYSEGYSQTSADSNNTSCHEEFMMPECSDHIIDTGTQVEQFRKPVEINTVDYTEKESQSQPVYANAEELTKCIQNGDSEPSTDCLSCERRLSSEESFTTKNSSPDPNSGDGSTRKVSRPWMFAQMFEPIEESEEHVSRSNSDSTVKARDDIHPLVTSSTPGDEDILEDDDLFNEDSQNTDTNEKDDDESSILMHANSKSKCRRPVARSATWDGWMNDKSKKQIDNKQITKDVKVQTETDDDSIDSGSDIIIRTAL
ncbi:hypothetical protein EG68_06434 [Paragonimus skrjabini miyazakii]|uniref:IRS-type PTB domain-containing protein n=1 Tax=Paragonimus skrjabini miyazakii TaxID=59628 RepID=A0A8S9YWX9_9TREM|nr:hypothetical protein EG68_06434 [Paragonimus skrjabini miyazakii]